ncbi:MAG: hypothetical protein QOI40_1469, partial [Alphaproteobacteria bacterium]|nr:hypothetical protein [Alphaproteobacteria bacterium]
KSGGMRAVALDAASAMRNNPITGGRLHD